jgi:8-oxo-dGTP diphosphatase
MVDKAGILPIGQVLDIDPRISGHFTASAIVIGLGHILLVHHKRIGAWLPPGGHINQTEMPHQAAVREVLEETGVSIEILSEPLPVIADSDAFFPPQPLCIHTVKAFENKTDVYHFDLTYLAKPRSSKNLLPNICYSKEVNEARWFRLEEVADLSKDLLAKNVPELITLAAGKMKLLNL